MNAGPIVKVSALKKRFGSGPLVLDGIDLEVNRGEFVSFIGPSGCGKSTLLRLIAGLTSASEGSITVEEVAPEKARKRMFFVFQEPTLMPWLTVRQNIAFAVKSRWPDWSKTQVNEQVEKNVTMVGLAHAIDKKPSQLSGGMKQRVGIARAFAIEPKMLLLDEPFGALDALTRGTIQDELMGIVRETQQTVFMITHDVDEAILLSDRILLMTNGQETDAGYKPGGMAEVVVNPMPRSRTRAELHHLPGYYDLRNHIVDFLVSRAKAH